jgi:uncharacterized protein
MKRLSPRPQATTLASTFVCCSCVLLARAARAEPSELFISEYVEGSGNNKAIELYNGSATAIDLAAGDYQLRIYFNGNATSGLSLALAGTVATGDVFVLAHSGSDPALLAHADQTTGAGLFNGDDAIELVKAGLVIDRFGQVGVDPGTEWTGVGWPAATGSADNTLRRKRGSCAGDAASTTAFDPAAEWNWFPSNDFSDVGAHAVDCGGGEEEPPPQAVCGDPATRIHAIQGSGAASPLANQKVSVEAVVVGAFQGTAALDGFFLQEPDASGDGDAATSEGLFVFDGAFGTDVRVGDVVRVDGSVTEYFGLTELASVTSIQVCGSAPVPSPLTLVLPLSSPEALEAAEGMFVRFAQRLFVSETFDQGRFGEVLLAAGGRLMQPTNVVLPGAPAQALLAANQLRSIQLDDGSNVQDPTPPPYLGQDNTLRIGDSTSALSGVLGYGFGAYEVHPTSAVQFTRNDPRPLLPPDPGGRLRVASFNVLNYFTTLDDGAPQCGPSGTLDCRGANTPSELTRQRDKILEALSRMDADIVGLLEIQNDDGAAVLDLVEGLNARLGADTYTAVDTGPIGSDAIRVAIIYKPESVSPLGPFAILDSSVDPTFVDARSRPVLAQTFGELKTGEVFTLAVNHLKSKGSSCADIGDPDTGDGQGNCNLTRTRAAAAEAAWLAADPTGSGDPDFLLVGDFNAYALEDPVRTLTAAGYENLIARFVGSTAYSYVFEGQSGSLDHAFASASLAAQAAGASEWHINADEPHMLDYNEEFNPPSLYRPDPFRASDHDPLIVGLALASEGGAPPPNECKPEPQPRRSKPHAQHHGRGQGKERGRSRSTKRRR